MVTQDHRMQNPPRPSRPRDVPGNGADHKTRNPDDERESVDVHRSRFPEAPASSRRGRNSEMVFVAPLPDSTRKSLWLAVLDYITSIFGYAMGVATGASRSGRRTFSVVLSVTIVSVLFLVVASPSPFSSAGRSVDLANYHKLIDIHTRHFGRLLDVGADYNRFVLEAGIPISVRLGGSGDEGAVRAERNLHSLEEQIQGAVDLIMSLNDYILQTIEASKAPPSLVPHILSSGNPTKGSMTERFLLSMDNVMVRLREEAKTSVEHLKTLHIHDHGEDDRLTGIEREADEHLAGIIRKLKAINESRRKALAHVVATLNTLHTLDVDIQELRARMAAPDVIGDKTPIEVHTKTIRADLGRLKEAQMRARVR